MTCRDAAAYGSGSRADTLARDDNSRMPAFAGMSCEAQYAAMPKHPTRRDILKTAAALPLVYAAPVCAAAPPAQGITPGLIAAATKDGELT
jgi:hypothetical protein